MKKLLLVLTTAMMFVIVTSSIAAPPDLTAGGVPNEDPAITINLGPTGARGWVYHVKVDTGESRQILVTEVDSGSPASGILAVDDVILGADGTGANPVAFSSDARKSLALAIADAEARSPATLKLLRWRGGATSTVTLTLQTMGAYSATAPYNCSKSSLILQQGLQYVYDNEDSGRYSFGAITLLANGNSTYLAKAQTEARALIPSQATMDQMMSDERDASSMITWQRGHTLIFLAEYYLATGDTQVLPAVEAYAVNIAKNTSLFGTVGHIFAEKNPDGSPNGPMGGVYGVVNTPGLFCFLGVLLAKECGLTNPEIDPAIERASRFFAYYSGKGGIPYGEHEPFYQQHENNGKSGLTALAFMLQDNRVEEGKFFAKMSTASATEREVGHTGSFFNYVWAPLGAAVGGEEAAAAHFSRISWMLDLNRCWNGKFQYDCLNGEGPNSGSTYNNFRMSTAALLTYALPLRQMYITGKGHDSNRWLSSAEVTEAIAADDYDASSRSNSELIADLDNWSARVRKEAGDELGSRSIDASELSQITAIANNTGASAGSRAGACYALGQIADSSSAATLAGLLTDSDEYVRLMATEAMRYLPTADKLSQLNAILTAADTTSQPLYPMVEDDPLHFAHGKLGVLLFYHGTAYGPKGVIWGSGIDGVDRNLLYPAIEAIADTPVGFCRSTLQMTYDNLTYDDVLTLSGTIVDSIIYRAPSDKMFSGGVREGGVKALEKYGIAEGVPACMAYAADEVGGRRNIPLGLLGTFGGGVHTVEPDPGAVPFLESYLTDSETAATAQASLDAIAADPDPTPLMPLKSIQSVTADASTVIMPTLSTVLHVNSGDYAEGDSIYTWSTLSGPSLASFFPNGTAAAADTTVVFDGTPGTYQFEVKMSDSRGLTEETETVTVQFVNSGGAGQALKVFILAGQSNMEGHGEIDPITTQGTLEYIFDNDPVTYGLLKDSGDWAVRDDVWIWYKRGGTTLLTGDLTVGYGAYDHTIGPELQFGHVMGNALGEKVLIIKTAWGGKSLAVDFRPPSSGWSVNPPVVAGDQGFYYQEMMNYVNDVLSNLSTYFPSYNPADGYEIAGFGWHQGWNDRVDPSIVYEYETHMANFINDVRTDLGVPDMPFVIATTGMSGWDETHPRALAVMEAQLAMEDFTKYPEFEGNVAVVDTRDFWRDAAVSPADQGYHWNRNAETYYLIGQSMGLEMQTLIAGADNGVTDTISVNFYAYGAMDPADYDAVTIEADEYAGVGSYITTGWENYLVPWAPTSPRPPVTITGTQGGTATLTLEDVRNGGPYLWNAPHTTLPGDGNGDLMDGHCNGTEDPGDGSAIFDMTVSDITFGAYDVIIYMGSNAAQFGDGTANIVFNGGPEQDFTLTSGEFAGFAEITDSVTPGNYIVYENVTGSSFTVKVWGNGFNHIGPTGFQIVGKAAPFVPDVVGMTQANAEAAIVAAGFTVGTVSNAYSDSVPVGDVISQNPPADTQAAAGSAVDIVVSLGVQMVTVPNVVGQAQATAEANIVAAQLVVGSVTTAYSDTVSAGDVISQSPTAGTSVVHDSAVNIVVSLGVQMVTVPNVVGMTQATAESTITAAILTVGNVTNAYSDTVPAGDVISQNPTAGASVVHDSPVDIVVSLGVQMVTVPNVVGQAQATAESNIVAAQLFVGNVTTAYSDTVSAGDVISQNPAGGASVVHDSAVDIVVSLGVQMVTVPNVVGQAQAAAEANIVAAQLVVGNVTTAYSSTVPAGNVISQNPTGGAIVAHDSPVDLVVSLGVEPDTTPPTPNPATFAVAPAAASSTAITMTATTGSDISGPVEYLFTETSGNPGGTNSGWQTSPTYTDTGLNPDTQYTYTVTMRDSLGNTTAASGGASATTLPAPSGQTIVVPVTNGDFETIYKPGSTTITATLSGWTKGVGPDCPIDSGSFTFSDQTTGSVADIPGWVGYDRDGWIALGGTYGRDQTTGNLQGSVAAQGNHTPGGATCYLANGGSWGNPAGGLIVTSASLGTVQGNATYTLSMYAKGAATPVALKLLANGVEITPSSAVDPTLSSTFQEFTRTYDEADLTGYVGQALTIVCGVDRNALGTQTQMDDVSLTYFVEADPPTPNPATFASAPAAISSTAITMTATTGTDASGPVEYLFTETSGNPGATSSGWQTSPTYTDTGLTADTQYTYKVTMRDALGNTGTASAGASATTDKIIFEMEDGVLTGAVIATNHAGFTGTGFVDYTASTGSVELTVNVSTAGSYNLSYRYALGAGDRPLEIKVNGQVVDASLSFPATGSWTTWGYTATLTVNLNAGANTVTATGIGSSGANVDHLKVE